MDTSSESSLSIRVLSASDLDAVTAIDRGHSGQGRRRFFEKRLAAERVHPLEFVQVGAALDGQLKGFAIARVLRGEHGQDATAVIDAIGVDRDSAGRGIGRALMKELIKVSQERGCRSLQSQVAWEDSSLVQFFRAAGFALAPRLALERTVTDLPELLEEQD